VRIVILGAGVIGVTTAHYLARAGHDVVVIDRQPQVGLETSFANAGEISPGYASPWAAPGMPSKALKWLFMRHAPLIIQPKPDPAMLSWLLHVLKNCNARSYAINKGRMVRLAEYSRNVLRALRQELRIEYDGRSLGTLQIFRTQQQIDGIEKDTAVLARDGVTFEVLDRDGCLRVEPGLAAAAQSVAGGLRLPGDETGDCFKFTSKLADHSRTLGVTYRLNESVAAIERAGSKVSYVTTDKGVHFADAFVVALGSYSRALLKTLGIRIPVYPVKGYSITASIRNAADAPQSTVMDETFKVAITRLGDRIRVGGMAEISGFDSRLPDSRRRTLIHSAAGLFRDAADWNATSYWSGLRPMTPDGTPIVGATELDNLYVNTGHGTLGWTMACGSARVLADLMSDKRPDIDVSDLSIARYRAGEATAGRRMSSKK
jgi:D-amino-acid dehydrogenase